MTTVIDGRRKAGKSQRAMIDALIETPSPQTEVAPRAEQTLVPDDTLKNLVNVFKLLSDETRLRILTYLCQTPELHVRALCERLDQSQPAVSHHLALLRDAGLIAPRRDGKHNFYRLCPDRIHELISQVFAATPASERRAHFVEFLVKQARG